MSTANASLPSGEIPVGDALQYAVQKSTICEPGAAPFHLKTQTTSAYNFGIDLTADIEEYWVSPEKWRRTIHAPGFDQTIIVNGKSRFEQDSADYYPIWLQDIVTAIFDVVPPQTLTEIASLNDTVSLADGNDRVGYHPTSTDGKVFSTWSGAIDFESNSGLLNNIFTMSFDAVYSEYKPFHGKQIARAIETFPPVPRGDVNTRITELSDLRDVDESLFSIPHPSPTGQELRSVYVPEVEYRKLAIAPPAMNWPPLKIRPTSGTLATIIVTDRSGKVRDSRFIIADNMNIEASAIELVKQWHFKPYLVDGVPVQVETTMTFAFNTAITGDQANFQAASYYFKRGRDLTFPRVEGSAPFHMKGTFEGAGIFTGFQGTYEETWFAPNRWRREIAIPGYPTMVETRLDDDHYIRRPAGDVANVVARVLRLFAADFPGFATFSTDTDWNMANVSFENVPVIRVAMTQVNDDGQVKYPRAFYFDQEGRIRARAILPEVITYGDFTAFGGKQVPKSVVLKVNDLLTLTARIDSLEPAGPEPDDFFVLEGVKPDGLSGSIPW
ncbi:MAG TPA: energy transducer TonB [Candidatus Acidoferrales bacterium]|nr:energy transducer TonB [Candidatus Acidoferrales bacterium]